MSPTNTIGAIRGLSYRSPMDDEFNMGLWSFSHKPTHEELGVKKARRRNGRLRFKKYTSLTISTLPGTFFIIRNDKVKSVVGDFASLQDEYAAPEWLSEENDYVYVLITVQAYDVAPPDIRRMFRFGGDHGIPENAPGNLFMHSVDGATGSATKEGPTSREYETLSWYPHDPKIRTSISHGRMLFHGHYAFQASAYELFILESRLGPTAILNVGERAGSSSKEKMGYHVVTNEFRNKYSDSISDTTLNDYDRMTVLYQMLQEELGKSYFLLASSKLKTAITEAVENDVVNVLLTMRDLVQHPTFKEQNRRISELVGEAVQEARPFAIRAETYTTIVDLAEGYLLDKFEKEYEVSGVDNPSHHLGYVSKLSEGIPFPHPAPFDITYLGYRGGVQLDYFDGLARKLPTNIMVQAGDTFEKAEGGLGDSAVYLVGHVIDFKEEVILEILLQRAPAETGGRSDAYAQHFLFNEVYANGSWLHPFTFTPWAVTALMALINDKDVCVEEAVGKAPRGRPTGKGQSAAPKPKKWYTVEVSSRVIRRTLTKSGVTSGRFYTHQFDVRGHERMLVRRGDLPLGTEDLDRLHKLDYLVFAHEELDETNKERLRVRGLPQKRYGEWVAIKVCRVKPHVKGPEGAEHLPSVHVFATSPKLQAVMGALREEGV